MNTLQPEENEERREQFALIRKGHLKAIISGTQDEILDRASKLQAEIISMHDTKEDVVIERQILKLVYEKYENIALSPISINPIGTYTMESRMGIITLTEIKDFIFTE